MRRLDIRLREHRALAGLSQSELARRAGISRQSLISIESGRFVPSTTIALRLAEALGCTVEALFALPAVDLARHADLAAALDGESGSSRRLVLGVVGGRWVAHALRGDEAVSLLADGIAAGDAPKTGAIAVEPLRGEEEIRANLIVAGCDPALTIVSRWLAERPAPIHLRVLHAPSRRALAALAERTTHLAGAHLLDEESGDYNVPFVRKACAGRGALVVNLARWEEGFVVRAGNPLSIRRAADLTRRRARLVLREPGSGARSVLDRVLREDAVPEAATHPVAAVARGHAAVARAVASGVAEVGIATRSVAAAYGLDFVPLCEERSDLAVATELRNDARIGRLCDALRGRALRRELESLAGYETRDSGQLIADVGGP